MPTPERDDEHRDATSTAATRPLRIEALATLPVFFKLSGKRAVVAGGTEPALWKAELLAASGADVSVYAETFVEGFDALAAAPPAGCVLLVSRRWQPGDLANAAIAVGAIASDDEASAFATAARAAGVPVNVIDRPAFCDFQFGAIVNRSPLVVAVSTDAAAPVLGQAIRSLIESLLPAGLRRWVEAAQLWRREGDRLGATAAERRRFWDRFAERAMREATRPPVASDLEAILAGSEAQGANPITIINIGAAGADGLTLGALRALRGADTIFADPGIPPSVLDFARREAHREIVGAGDEAAVAERIAAAAAGGRRVVCVRASNLSQNGNTTNPEGDRLSSLLRAAGHTVLGISAGR